MSNDLRVKVSLKATDQGLVAQLKLTKQEADALAKSMSKVGDSASQSSKQTDQVTKSQNKATSAVKANSAANKGLSRSYGQVNQELSKFRTIYASLVSVLATGSVVNTASQLEQMQIRLQRLSGTTVNYAENQQYLSELSQRLNRDYLTLSDSYSRILTLQKAGIVTQKEGRKILEGMTDAGAALGATNVQLGQVMFGMAQGFSSATLRAEELNQVTEPLPGLLQELDRAAGLASGGFRRLVNEGEVTSEFFKETLIKALQAYSGAAEDSADSIQGSWTDIRNAYLETVEAYKQPIADALAPLFASVADAIRIIPEYSGVLKVLFSVATGFVVFRTASLIVTSLGVATGITSSRLLLMARHMTLARARVIAMSAGVGILRGALAALGGPVGIVLTAAGAIASYMAISDKAEASTKSFADRVLELTGNFDELHKKELAAAIEEGTAELDAVSLKIRLLKETINASVNRGVSNSNSHIVKQREELAALVKVHDELKAGLIDLSSAQDEGVSSTDDLTEARSSFLEGLQEQLQTIGLNAEQMMRYRSNVAAGAQENIGFADKIKKTTEAIIAKKKALAFEKDFKKNQSYIASLNEELEAIKLSNEERFVEASLRKLSASATDEQTQKVTALAAELYSLQQAKNVDKTVTTTRKETNDLRTEATVSGLESQGLAPLSNYFAQRQAEIETQLAIERAQETASYQLSVEERTARFDERLIALAHDNEAVAALKAEQREQEELAHQIHLNKLNKSERNYAKQKERLNKETEQRRVQGVRGMFSDLASLMNSHNEKAFKVGKAAAIAQTVIDTYQAAQSSYNSLASIPYVGPILGAAAAAAAIAAGMGRVNAIRSQQFQGQAHAGIDNIPREGTYLLDGGERVVDSRTNADLKQAVKVINQGSTSEGAMSFNFTFNGGGHEGRASEFAEYVTEHVINEISERKQRRDKTVSAI